MTFGRIYATQPMAKYQNTFDMNRRHTDRQMPDAAESARRPGLTPEEIIDAKARFFILSAALLALFLGALDALIMSAAMPSIVADLGGLPLYSWVYSTYLLSRAVALPVFGKLADLYRTRSLFVISIGLFVLSSIVAVCFRFTGPLVRR